MSLMPFWVILGVIAGIILAVEMDRNSSDGMGLLSLFLSVPFCIILSVSLGSLIGYIFPAESDNRYKREKDWEESAEGGVDQMMTQADIEDLSRENSEILAKIEKLEKDIL